MKNDLLVENVISAKDGEKLYSSYLISLYTYIFLIFGFCLLVFFLGNNATYFLYETVSHFSGNSDRLIDQINYLNNIDSILGLKYYTVREISNFILMASPLLFLPFLWTAKREGIRSLRPGYMKGVFLSAAILIFYTLWLIFGGIELSGDRNSRNAWFMILMLETNYLILFYGFISSVVFASIGFASVLLARALFGVEDADGEA